MHSVVTITGEERRTKTCTVKTYFFGRTPAGVEMFLNKFPGVVTTSTFKTPSTSLVSPKREVRTTMDVPDDGLTIKMFTAKSEFGKLGETHEVYINPNREGPLISLKGLDEFGSVVVHGFINRELTKVPDAVLVKTLQLRQLEAGKVISKQGIYTRKVLR